MAARTVRMSLDVEARRLHRGLDAACEAIVAAAAASAAQAREHRRKARQLAVTVVALLLAVAAPMMPTALQVVTLAAAWLVVGIYARVRYARGGRL